ncbi:MAG: M14 metallopeptidase family protein [Planctomycetota bacterium]
MRVVTLAPILALSSALTPGLFAQAVPTPSEHLGRPVASDFTLADWSEVASYHRRVAAASDRVLVESVGTTTEGREFLLTVVSDPANLARLDEIRADARRIADPAGIGVDEREALLQRAKPILFCSLGMHSTETSPPQFGMELLHALATSDEPVFAAARRELVVVIAPCLNPDGLDHVVDWYRRTVASPYEAAGLTQLYQRYSGHDNNRDWFALTQAETRIVTRELYHRWFPHVYWDVHEQGRNAERFFVPPFRDPLTPNVSPRMVTGIDELGTRALFDMTREGLTGIATGVTYDMWWNGGNRNVPVRHRILGLLTEAASVRFATPVFLPVGSLSAPNGLGAYAPSNRFPAPWPGGWWRLRDIVDYENAFARSLLGSLAREPRTWLENALSAAEEDLERARDGAPRGWIVPASNRDHGAVERLVDVLLLSGIRIFRAAEPFVADGRQWPAASLVLPREQPYGEYLKGLMEAQVYPEGDDPYDVAGWTLPLLFGVSRVAYQALEVGELASVDEPALAAQGFARPVLDANERDSRDSHAWREAIEHLGAGGSVTLSPAARGGSLRFDEENALGIRRAGLPRIGVVAPWTGVKNEGWLRWMLEHFGLPTIPCRFEMLRAGDLGAFLDVLVIPSLSASALDDGRREGSVPAHFAGGLGADGRAAVADFVRGGGTLIALERASTWAIELFGLLVDELTAGADDFACPGSVLRAHPVQHALTAGVGDAQHLFFANSLAFRTRDEDGEHAPPIDSLLEYSDTQLLASGWIADPEAIAGTSAWVRARVADGRVHLFGFRPQYRAWSQAAFLLFLRAALFDA